MSNKAFSFKLLGVVSPGAASIAQPVENDPPLTKTIIPGALVGVLGLGLWPEHRVLGFMLGESAGLNGYRAWRGQGYDRTRAACNFAATVAGVAGSLSWKAHPFYGYVLGFILGTAATALVPGSNAYRTFRK